MNINTHIIDHEIKLMKMGGREEILLERETINLIIFIHAQRLTTCRGLRGNERSEEYCMVSWRRGQEVRNNLRCRKTSPLPL
jgi:hypothetical protein